MADKIYGASSEEWQHFVDLGLGQDLLPVVSDPNIKISPRSRITSKGKLPSTINNNGFMVGLTNWTNRTITDSDIKGWKTDHRLGICIRLGNEYCINKHIRVSDEKTNETSLKNDPTIICEQPLTYYGNSSNNPLFDKSTQRYLVALDVDSENLKDVENVANTLQSYFGIIPPKRFRSNSNKCLFMFAIEDEQLPKRIMRLADGGMIEFLAKGQQFVAVGTHPSGVRYEWEGGLPTNIPTISLNEFNNFWETLPLILDVVDESSQSLSKNRDLSQGDSLSSDEVAEFLDNNCEVFGIGNRGERFIRCPFESEHSSDSGNETSTAYFPAETGGFEMGHFKCQHAHCASRSDNDFLDAIGFYDDMFDEIPADTENPANDWVAEFVRRYVYVAENDRVLDLEHPHHSYMPKLSEFKNYTANITIMKAVSKNKLEPVPVWKEWLSNHKRQSVISTVYLPGQDMFIEEQGGARYFNTFHFPKLNKVSSKDKLHFFLEHIEYLIPNADERKHFLQWMASLRQHPERRNKVTNMLVSVPHGTGRGWVVELLQIVLGKWNCTKCKMGDLVDGQFNGFMYRSILCCVEEVKERNDRFAISDKVRDTLTEKDLEVNIKYGAKKTIPVYTNFFFMTNHRDALVLREEDRRINAFDGPDKAKSKDYYDNLYNLLEDSTFIDEVYSYLITLDLSDYRWTHSFDTPARRNMIEFNRSDIEVAFLDFLEKPPVGVMTLKQITDFLNNSNDDLFIDESQLVKLLQHHVGDQRRLKYKGKMLRPWVLCDELKNVENDIYRLHIEKAEHLLEGDSNL
ncbi:DUF5906 domain-containing protein [Phocoenobacter skyensis]|uniref:NrS-1 polymerase-like helicase domain-containing protein n=2 Tax=Phocoenobacter skyensis TaxID=97481 RepID=A0A1H7V960_9PAST|nr:DUF5906 domain-containing protein [Pasteurella skyensis]QLB23338.1 hypothetical protein A6B44_09020 [Pasteurella skyensis]SEM05277.1 hypothetical protein SAMN05444853_1045 [Pasteurella skyensis]